MQKVLILGAGEMQVPIIQKAKEMGLFTIVADFNVDAPGLHWADEKAIISTNDIAKILALAKEKAIDGILTTSDFPVNTVAKVANELNLNAMSTEVAKLCTNKFRQREFFKNAGIKTPIYKLVANLKEIDQITAFPVILKPTDSSASRGVKKVNSIIELKEQYPITGQYSLRNEVIVEEFIEGREFSVEALTQNNSTSIIAITEKLVKGEEVGYFVEDTHIIPARINNKERQLIINEVLTAIKEMGINNCPTHTEVKLNLSGAFIIEIACRLGGDYITSDLVPLAYGVDMLECLINISIGNKISTSFTCNNIVAIQFLNTNNYTACINFINSKSLNIVRSEVKEFHSKEIKSSMDRLGYIILKATTVDEITSIINSLN